MDIMRGSLLVLAVATALTLVAQTAPTKSECTKATQPKIVYAPDPEPPDSWVGSGPHTATSIVELTIDKKGIVQNPHVTKSAGKEVDAKALSAVRRWRFQPARCDDEPREAKIQINVMISSR